MRKKSHQEIQKSKPSIEGVKAISRMPIFVLLDNVRSLYNVGSIFRTSEAVLVEKIFLCGITGYPPRKEISKTALGAEEIVPFEYEEEACDVVKRLKAEGVKVCAVELCEGSEPYDGVEFDFPVCFVFGHEVEGVSDEVMELVDMAIEVPMLGRANSLNVASCVPIILYEALKQLRDAKK
ncbi:RNA methyltransferase [Patescibacteria group bacterium]|nr:RNA methyltransferase [Patescibacteria group bacterium]